MLLGLRGLLACLLRLLICLLLLLFGSGALLSLELGLLLSFLSLLLGLLSSLSRSLLLFFKLATTVSFSLRLLLQQRDGGIELVGGELVDVVELQEQALLRYATAMKVKDYVHFCQDRNYYNACTLNGARAFYEVFFEMTARDYVSLVTTMERDALPGPREMNP